MTNIVTLDVDAKLANLLIYAIECIDDKGQAIPKELADLSEKLDLILVNEVKRNYATEYLMVTKNVTSNNTLGNKI